MSRCAVFRGGGHRRQAGAVKPILIVIIVVAVLAIGAIVWYVNRGTPEEAAAGGPRTQQQQVAAPVEDTAEREAQLRESARAALREQRWFAPPGDNAMELYLDLLQIRPEDVSAREAVTESMPYAVLAAERALAARDYDETERLIALIRRADERAPSLGRLERELTQARERADREAAEQERLAARPAPEPTPPPQPVAPEPQPTQPAQPPPSQPVAATTPPPQQTPPPQPEVAEPEPAAAQPAGPVGVPRVVSRSAPRYPPQALRRRLEGWVEVEFTINPDGSVSDATVVDSSSGVFEREALRAVLGWRFESPGAEVRTKQTIDFKLQ